MSIQVCKPKTIDEKCRKCALWADSPFSDIDWPLRKSVVVTYECDGSHSDECRFLEDDRQEIEEENFF